MPTNGIRPSMVLFCRFVAGLPGCEIRVSLDGRRTRLHAKAWLFRRNTGFDTAYVGSSNLSRAAMLDGVEWNVRLSAVSTPPLLHKFLATFDSYWNDKRAYPAQSLVTTRRSRRTTRMPTATSSTTRSPRRLASARTTASP